MFGLGGRRAISRRGGSIRRASSTSEADSSSRRRSTTATRAARRGRRFPAPSVYRPDHRCGIQCRQPDRQGFLRALQSERRVRQPRVRRRGKLLVHARGRSRRGRLADERRQRYRQPFGADRDRVEVLPVESDDGVRAGRGGPQPRPDEYRPRSTARCTRGAERPSGRWSAFVIRFRREPAPSRCRRGTRRRAGRARQVCAGRFRAAIRIR